MADIGIWGLGVMGRNLAQNLAGHGYSVVLYDPWKAAREAAAGALAVAETAAAFAAALSAPRSVLLMVKAGAPVDAAIAELLPLLRPGDLVMDGGNSHYRDSARRAADLAARGIQFLDLGISGGEVGARLGPSIMAGGDAAAFARVAPMLNAIAAQVEGQPCCAYMGADGAGHFVKMVHNGIEYADMQLIAETYLALRDIAGLDHAAMGNAFASWNKGVAGGYLLEITMDILARRDERGAPLLELVLDQAEQKGTGQWASVAALELGVPAPTITEAVAARALSALKAERVVASGLLPGPRPARASGEGEAIVSGLGDALLAGKICAYAQGFAMLAAAAAAFGWPLDLARTAEIWRGGCIIRSQLLTPIAAAFRAEPTPANLLAAPQLRDVLEACQAGWRGTVASAATHGLSVPGLGSALAYYDAYRAARSWANLIQAQRDAFGAHFYARIDRPGTFHTDWSRQ